MTVNEQIAYIEEKIFSLSEQVKKIKQDSLSPKTEFEVGKWYCDPKYPKRIFCPTELHGDRCRAFGFDHLGAWFEGFNNVDLNNAVLVTESEVKEALIKEAEKRGFKEGVKLAPDSFFGHSLGITLSNKREFNYNIECDEFSILGGSSSGCKAEIYKQGKWATIVKDEAIKIGGETVVFGSGSIAINGVEYSKAELECLKKITDKGQVKSLNVGCDGQYKVTTKELKSILEKLK